MSLGNKSLLTFLILLVLAVSFITWLSYRNNKSYHEALKSVGHSNEVLYSAEQLVSTLKDVQLFSHNYVFTKSDRYIKELDSAIAKSENRLQVLRNLVRDNPAQSKLVDSLSFYINQRIDFSKRIIESRRNNQSDAFEMVATGKGIDLMKSLVLIVRQIRQMERDLLKQRQESTALQLYQFNIFFNLTIAVIIAMTALTVIITLYNSRLESKIKAQVRQLSSLNSDLEKRERRFKGLIENGFDVISLLNEEIKPIYRSPAAERITGWSNEERTKIVGVEKAHPDDKDNFKETIRQVLENPGKAFDITIRTQHKDGHYIWLEGIMKNMLHDDSLQGIVSNFRDVTERKKIETQRALYESIIQYSEDAIVSKSTTGLVITWNRGAEALFGYKAEEIIGKSFALFTPDDLIDEEVAIIKKVQNGIPVENFETERLTKTGKRISISLTASPLFDTHGKMVGTSQIARDITERKNAEEKIHRLNIELEQRVILRTKELAQVNKELEAVSFYISKGIQAPLNEIQNIIAVLERQLKGENIDSKTSIQSIQSNVQEGLVLLGELIQFSEISQQKFQRKYVDMNELVEQLYNDGSVLTREMRLVKANKLHPVIGDFDLLKRLFESLLRIRHRDNSLSSPLEITSEVNHENVCYSIVDRHSMAFDSLLKTHPDQVGTEGPQALHQNFVSILTIKHIVQKHSGTLRAEPLDGTGSSVTFAIPIK